MSEHKTILELLEQEEKNRTLEPWETALKDMKPLIRQLRVFCTSKDGYIDVQLFSDFLIQECLESIVATSMELGDKKFAPRYVAAIMERLEKEKVDDDFQGKEGEIEVSFHTPD